MRKGITDWCCACLTCATHQTSMKGKPLLVPIPVGGPWDRVEVDTIQMPKSCNGNQYAFFATTLLRSQKSSLSKIKQH